MSSYCCPFASTISNRVIAIVDTTHSKYHIECAIPTGDDIRAANTSWFRILSRSAEGFLAAKENNTVDSDAELTPVVFFYDTFFQIWKTKSIFVLDQIYRNNNKIKSSSMISMINYILNCKKHSDKDIEEMVKRHSKMGVTLTHYTLMSEVVIETIQKVLKITDADEDVIMAWRRIMSWMIERIETAFSK